MKTKRKREQKWVDAVTPQVTDAVTAHAINGALDCERARRLAEDLAVPYPVIGAAADEVHVRIKNCGLGCF